MDENHQQNISFLLRPPVDPNETKATEESIKNVIETAWKAYKSGGTDALIQHLAENRQGGRKRETQDENELPQTISNVQEKQIMGDPRRYQIKLFDYAKARNTIVSLGTGQGKTLIAMMTIRHFALDIEKGDSSFTNQPKQTWFLVPSVALAVQQSRTIQWNLPYTVATACHTAVCSEKARTKLSNAQVVVATHGSALELLRHFGDLFSLSRVNLLVFDECHHAMKKHNYATLMQKFYDPLPINCRPHVVGLTASPIINVPKNVTDVKLHELLNQLETTLDSTLVSLSTLGLSKQEAGVIENNVRERVVYYYNATDVIQNYPPHNSITGIHKCRRKELEQFKHLYVELGPTLVVYYIDVVLEEISRNHFERESHKEFNQMRQFMICLRDYLQKQCLNDMKEGKGKSGKLMALEKLLVDVYDIDNRESSVEEKDIVGIIFVQRRITALALKHYLHSTTTLYDGGEHIRLTKKGNKTQQLRCDLLTRQTTHVFKYLNASHKLSKDQQEKAHDDWLHKMSDSREVLDKLRRREINLLICTSVVEEGVDVDACSFVIVLDGMQTTKGYIQMKGRARQLDAQFFVFENIKLDEQQAPVTLSHANQIESQVTDFIGGIKHLDSADISTISTKLSPLPFSSSAEDEALRKGEYHSLHGVVHLSSAKSVVNRYALSVPMNINSRSCRAALQPYLPMYSNTSLRLPSHLPENIRCIALPEYFNSNIKKTNENMLALIACVRLHKLGILNDRLLPLQSKDIEKRLMSSALIKLQSIPSNVTQPTLGPQHAERKNVSIYPLIQSGEHFSQHDKILRGNGRCLCIVSLHPLRSHLSLQLRHSELGNVQCRFGTEIEGKMGTDEWSKCIDFYSAIINSRWSRRTGCTRFRCTKQVPYVIACMTSDRKKIDWSCMGRTIDDCGRSECDRKLAVENWFDGSSPRLWAPLYDPNNTYITFHQEEGVYASSPFPNTEFSTFRNYLLEKRSFKVAADCPMYRVQRLWELPNKIEKSAHDINKKISQGKSQCYDENLLCYGLSSVLMPKDACIEAPLSDAALFLHCIFLPQILYELDRIETTQAFLDHCSLNFPVLGRYLQQKSVEEVMEVITAKSCALSLSYDRMEYLGDAVLKLLQTDALISAKDKKLRRWIHCLHEGHLSALRSAMGCNERLQEASECSGINKFILTKPLSRGQWIPNGFESYKLPHGRNIVDLDLTRNYNFIPSEKVQADVVEALLGFIYLHFGYNSAIEVAEQLGISLPKEADCPIPCNVSVSKELLRKASDFLSIKEFMHKERIVEATTHPSKVHSKLPSYQKLEWVGDAVLCLAAREWVYKNYPKLPVKNMVQIETILVCNETLALLGSASGLRRHIDHCDSTLPSLLERYEIDSESKERGLWGTDPPKVLADVVEALIGVAHIDGGYEQGQISANFVLQPMTAAILLHDRQKDSKVTEKKCHNAFTHPKQMMLEVCEALKVKAFPSHDCTLNSPSKKIWFGKSWGNFSEKKGGIIGEVLWCENSLCAVADNVSNTVAKNRACALVNSVLLKCPNLRVKLNEMSEKVNKRDR